MSKSADLVKLWVRESVPGGLKLTRCPRWGVSDRGYYRAEETALPKSQRPQAGTFWELCDDMRAGTDGEGRGQTC